MVIDAYLNNHLNISGVFKIRQLRESVNKQAKHFEEKQAEMGALTQNAIK
jgi:hypothetical protein